MIYMSCARGGGKSYEQFRRILELMANGEIPVCHELEPYVYEFKLDRGDSNHETQMRMYETLWPKENPFIRKENSMNAHIFKKEPIAPVMAEHIKRVNISEPKIECESVSEEGIDKTIANLRNHIYAKMVDMQDKVIIDAVINFARSEGFTDAYLIDKAYIMAALESKYRQDELERELEDAEERCNVKDQRIDELHEINEHQKKQIETQAILIRKLRGNIAELEEGQKLLEDRKATIKQLVDERDRLLHDLKCAHAEINDLCDEIKALKNKVVFLNGMCSGAEVLKKENDQLKKELKALIAANEDLNDRIKKMDKKLREPANDDRDMVIENQMRTIHELDHQLRKYKLAGHIIKNCIAVAEDREVKV